MLKPQIECCGNCKYFRKNTIWPIKLCCQRFPPQVTTTTVLFVIRISKGLYPATKPDGWCGEWQPASPSDPQQIANKF
jgi:hypothetical protein